MSNSEKYTFRLVLILIMIALCLPASMSAQEPEKKDAAPDIKTAAGISAGQPVPAEAPA